MIAYWLDAAAVVKRIIYAAVAEETAGERPSSRRSGPLGEGGVGVEIGYLGQIFDRKWLSNKQRGLEV